MKRVNNRYPTWILMDGVGFGWFGVLERVVVGLLAKNAQGTTKCQY
jgi:hypothetical protein